MDLEAIGGQGEVDPEGPAEASRDHHGDGPGDGSRGPSLDLDQGEGNLEPPRSRTWTRLETRGTRRGTKGETGSIQASPWPGL